MHARLHRQLSQIDWDFIAGDESGSGGIHWYPGSFVPGLPGALIEALSLPNDSIFDPYAGAGTTGIAAVLRGRGAVVCDLSPISVLSSYSAISLIFLYFAHRKLFNAIFEELDGLIDSEKSSQSTLKLRAVCRLQDIDKQISLISDRSPRQILKLARVNSPDVSMLRPWFERGTLTRLLAVLDRLENYRESTFVKLLGLAMVSAVARSLSSQTRSWGHIADNVLPLTLEVKDVGRLLRSWLWRTHKRLGRMTQLGPLPTKRPFLSVRMLDWGDPRPDLVPGISQLLVTSPPYAGAIDYTLAQRLSLSILGWDEDAQAKLCGKEMGARRRRFRASHIRQWADDLAVATTAQLEFLSQDGFAAYVMPHKDAGRDLGVKALQKAMTAAQREIVFTRDRSIRQARARQSWTSIKRETILIFEREGGA